MQKEIEGSHKTYPRLFCLSPSSSPILILKRAKTWKMRHEIHRISVKHEMAKPKFTFAVGATGGSGFTLQHMFPLCWRLVVRQPRVRALVCSSCGISKRKRSNRNTFQVERRKTTQEKPFPRLNRRCHSWLQHRYPYRLQSEPISSPKLSVNLMAR